MTYSSTILGETSLQAYYRLDDTTFAAAADSKGTNAGTFSNTAGLTLSTAGLVPGDADTAVTFNSASRGNISIPVGLAPTGNNPFSWEVWIHPTNAAASSQRIISNDTFTTNVYGACLCYDGGTNQIRFWHSSSNTTIAANLGAGSSGKTYHVVATYDGHSMRLYINSVSRGVVFDGVAITTKSASFHIGSDENTNSSFDGIIDEVSLYNTCLSGIAVWTHYNFNNHTSNRLGRAFGAYLNTGVSWDYQPPNNYGELDTWTNWATNGGTNPNKPGIFQAFGTWQESADFPTALAQQANERGADFMYCWQCMSGSATKGDGSFQPDQPSFSLQTVIDSLHDTYITHVASQVAAYGQPVLIRLFHEQNSDYYPWGLIQDGNNGNQTDYTTGVNTQARLVSAWQHVVTLFRNAGATNAKFVWTPAFFNDNFGNAFTMAGYPGDAWVDYVGLDGYNTCQNGTTSAWLHPYDVFSQGYATIVAATSKPFIVGEMALAEDLGGVYSKAADITQLFGTDMPVAFYNVVAFLWEDDVNYSHNMSINSSPAALAAFQAQMATSLYNGGPLLALNNPTLASISPAADPPGPGSVVITLTGTYFLPTSTGTWNGNSYPTVYNSPTSLTMTLPAGTIASAGTYNVGVSTPSRPNSGTLPFTVTGAAPTISSVSPNADPAQPGSIAITVNGTNFLNTSQVTWNGSVRTTNYVSATQLTATLNAGDLSTVGTQSVAVTTPGYSNTATLNFTVTVPDPTIVGVSPTSTIPTGTAVPLTVTGTNFLSTSVVTWDGSARSTAFNSATQLTVTLNAGDCATPGSHLIAVTTPGHPTTGNVAFTVANVQPTLTSLVPGSLPAGSAGQTIQVGGTNFASGATAMFNGFSRTVVVNSSTSLQITLLTSDLSTQGNYNIVVTNVGAAASAPIVFAVVASAGLSLVALSPSTAVVGASGFVLTVNGTGFVSTAVVLWNGVALPTTFVSSGQLTAAVPASDLLTVGMNVVTVRNA